MGAAGWHPQLLLSFSRQRDAIPLAAAGRLRPAIDDDVKDGAGGHAHQFSLGLLSLQVQSAQNALTRAAVVVLHKGKVDTRFQIALGVPGLEKKAAGIAVHRRGDQCHTRQWGRFSLHRIQARPR